MSRKYKLISKNRFNIKKCPCGKSNQDGKFVPFEGSEEFGYCHACSQTFLPDTKLKYDYPAEEKKPKPEIKYIPRTYLLQTTKNRTDNLSCFLTSKFGQDALPALQRYCIGISKHWEGATVFWYIDHKHFIRTGKIMQYDSASGRRVKGKTKESAHITWVHTKLNIPNENIKKCLFGEHLINEEPRKPIALVESEKSAIIASLFFPQFIWLATGGLGNLTFEKLKPLTSRKIVLFPDLGALKLWQEKAKYLGQWYDITISDYLELNATEDEKANKYDIADYLLKNNNLKI